jgi:Colicin immunity protein / pyocin immunity protein
MNTKEKLEDYTELEFLEFLGEFFENKHGLSGKDYENHTNSLLVHFEKITEHPEKSALIFYPFAGREDSPMGILKEVKEWRALNGKPGFKAP